MRIKLEDLVAYINSLENPIKVDITIEGNKQEGFYVTKTKETEIYESESEADERVDVVRQLADFAGTEKKFKQGKINKLGEVTRPDIWTVVTKMKF